MDYIQQPRPGNGAITVHPRACAGAILLALLCLPQAQAGGHHHGNYTYDNCTVQDSGSVVAHVVGEFSANSKQKDMLTEWIDMPHPAAWSCTRYTSNPNRAIDILVKPFMPGHFLANFNFEGGSYTIYRSPPPAKEQVGYIMKRRYTIKADNGFEWSSSWLPVRHDNDGGSHFHKYTLALPHLERYTVSIESQVRLLKWHYNKHKDNTFPNTGQAIEFNLATWRYWVAQQGAPPAHSGQPPVQDYGIRPKRYSSVRVWFNRDDRTCSTPVTDKTVLLPHVNTAEFVGVGTVAGNTPFTLDLSNCSPHIASIEYKLTPVRISAHGHNPTVLETTPWPLTTPQGTLPLSPHSTATGVLVQVLDENGTPVRFDRTTRLVASTSGGYTPGSPSGTISLQAQYLQTAPAVTAGSVYATMSVLYMYK